MDHRHLWLRSRRQHALMRIRAEVIRAATEFLDRNGYLRMDAPILTPASVEGTTTLFETPYFEKGRGALDRKSTRLNSSHGYISYAVFCLKKKKKQLNTSVRQLFPPLLCRKKDAAPGRHTHALIHPPRRSHPKLPHSPRATHDSGRTTRDG